MVTSFWACRAAAFPAWIVPGAFTTPGGKPVTAVPGLTPRLPPSITVEPVLVTVEPARTAKPAAVPSEGAVAAFATD